MDCQNQRSVSIAIIGMGGLFPKSAGLTEYWRNLFHGTDAITEVPETHWAIEDYYDDDPKAPDRIYCKRGGFLPSILFDPMEFGIPPSSMEATDTSQLLGLVAARMALEDAGYGDDREFDRSKTSVILGVTGTQELVIPLSSRLGYPQWRRAIEQAGISADTTSEILEKMKGSYVEWQENSFPGLLGNVVAGRICNRLNLGGTNCVVDAACASSLSAMNLALLELASGRSNLVVTGGIDTLNDIFMHMCFARTLTLSRSGDARPFSKDADGTVLGEGIGIVVLKRLDDAEQDGDKIYAVIRGLGASSDGKSQSIYAPNAEGQVRALRAAYADAEFDPATVTLLEAHGTGTKVGDKVEFNALSKAFGEAHSEDKRCALGSVKSMIGHTKAAAGAAGVIKTALALYHKVLPPTLKADDPDPDLKIDDTPFYLNTDTRPWFSADDHPRRAGVSAFGFGGSNFHVVLEEYSPDKSEAAWDESMDILAFSGSSKAELARQLTDLTADIASGLSENEFALRLSKARSDFSHDAPYRALLVLEKQNDTPQERMAEIQKILSKTEISLHAWDPKSPSMSRSVFFGGPEKPDKIGFLFPGQGSQYVSMGRDLVCTFPEAFETIERSSQKTETSPGLSRAIYPIPAFTKQEKIDQEAALRQTDIAQPAIGAVSMAMLKVLRRFGVKPDVVCGHSFGELTALYAAGWMDEDTFTALSAARGALMAGASRNCGGDPGTMLAVKAPLHRLEEVVRKADPDIVLANRNSPEQGVLSGPSDAIVRIDKDCRDLGFKTIKLPVAAAFHSRLVQDAQKPFMDVVTGIDLNPTDTPVFSNTTGQPYPRDVQSAKTLLGEQLIHSVDFVGNIEHMYGAGVRCFLEVGPKSVLTGLVNAVLSGKSFQAISLDASAGRQFGIKDLAGTLCRLAALGYPVRLNRWHTPKKAHRKQKMQLPICGANYRRQRPEASDSRPQTERPVRPVQNPQTDFSKGHARHVSTTEPTTSNARLRQTMPPTSPAGGLSPGQPKNDGRSTQAFARAATMAGRTADTAGVRSTAHENIMKNNRSNSKTVVSDALQMMREGLRSMQALQKQTAETHQKFLENQTLAAKTLREMMENAHHLTAAGLGLTFDPDIPGDPAAIPDPAEKNEPSPIQPASEHISYDSDEPKDHITETALADAAANNGEQIHAPDEKAPSDMRTGLASVMLAVVSELTGYPREMIGMDMDIEADLGIDSIKRVEILSMVEEKMPNLPPVSPEIMGTLKTLGQVADYLTAGGNSGNEPSPAVQTCKTPCSQNPTLTAPAVDPAEIHSVMLAVVSELTGYPREMIGMDMDIEADLGIDSIKRVEILSMVEEKMPNLPPVSPEIMGTLKTLGQVADYLTAGGNSGNEPSPAVQTCKTPCSQNPTLTAPAVDPAEIHSVMLAVVSELTGYPREMIGMDMDIEADLGIDSIKRVEILSMVEEKMPNLPPVSPEIMGTLKTLGQVADYLSSGGAAKTSPTQDALNVGEADMAAETIGDREASPITVGRQVVSVVKKAAIPGKRISLPRHRTVYISEDRDGLAQALAKAFADAGVDATAVSWEMLKEKPLPSQASGLILISDGRCDQGEDLLKDAFFTAQRIAQDLSASAGAGNAVFATISRIDGAFGFHGKDMADPMQGGLAGLVKTAAIEWPGVTCRAFDVSPEYPDVESISRSLVGELISPDTDESIEIGFDATSRYVLALDPNPYPRHPAVRLDLDPEDVLVVTGGARGITAAAVASLLHHAGPKLVLLGRSPYPAPEPDWLAHLSGEPDIKAAIMKNELSPADASPLMLEKAYQRRMANREVMGYLSEFQQRAGSVAYHAVDIRQGTEVDKILQEVRSTHGPIKGIIHGAGVLEDRLIVDKTPEQFNRVFDTKALGLQSLLRATQKDPLRYLVLFSSVSARFGNKGQADYAMANEVLNKMAQQEAARRPECRVVAINWGPWDGGMVTPSLKREFERNRIPLIPMAQGPLCMLYEMTEPPGAAAEIVLGAGLSPESAIKDTATGTTPRDEKLSLAFQHDVGTATYPILSAHVLDGKPVVPFALMAEWFGHGALHGNPGLVLYGIDDMRLLKGIKLDRESRRIRLLAGKAKKSGRHFEVAVELRDGIKNGAEVIHSRAKAILSEDLPSPAAFEKPDLSESQPLKRNMDAIYDDILFHGQELRGIVDIRHFSSKGIVAEVSSAPSPEKWILAPIRSQWIGDPLVMDAAFQMAIVWTFEELGQVSLPSYYASYRQHMRRFPERGITAFMEVREVKGAKMRCDYTFLDETDNVVARLTGYEATMDPALISAFK
jgi:acyl transferase domain-containing protein/NAD(P)-dependent dehydrogenase (short-subunit alcohol dehydrogenase family)